MTTKRSMRRRRNGPKTSQLRSYLKPTERRWRPEIAELDSFSQLATSIDHNAKGKALLKALTIAFAKARDLGAEEKAIIFTESRKTQNYLLRVLADSQFSEGIVLFNGSDTDFVDNILGRIATRVGELYEEVHPGEGLNKISLQLDPVKRASLDVVSQFPGATDSPPGAYLSESHLDTLGVCIFLALAELEAPEEKILVLDDVIASVDEPHVDRIIEMLYDISQKFAHCILTTHYTPWKEKYRWGFLKKGECHFVEFRRMDLGRRHYASGSTSRVERLRAQLSEPLPEVSEICASAGVILEVVLDFLTLQYGCAVPRSRTKPTLGDLLPAVKAKLRTVLRVEIHNPPIAPAAAAPTIQLGPILNKLETLSQVRNIMGCHFNDKAFYIPGKDGLAFGRLVLELAEALIDADHGWPGSDRSGEYWTNSGRSRRLYPLKRPS
jgi:hypothetical protein